MPELKSSPRNSALGKLADLLTRGRNAANEYEIKDWVPLLGGTGVGDLLIGKAPEEVNEWSYGNAPMHVTGGGTGSLIPQTKQGRQQSLADAVFLSQIAPAGGLTRIVKSLPAAVRHGAEGFAHASAAANPSIIKTKGGNWLTGSVENALAGLKRRMDPELEGYARRGQNLMPHEAADVIPKIALNNWIEGPLTKYVKRDMATEGDPVRKLAEQGILHYTPAEGFNSRLIGKRQGVGMPQMGVAKHPLAQSWEGYADAVINAPKAETYQNFGSSNMVGKPGWEWIDKVDPESRVYAINQPSSYRAAEEGIDALGFSHLTDELANALNPESGLPRHLLLTPEQMQQMGMEKAVRHVADINAWRAAQQAEANLARSQSPAVHMVREYTENNPKGLRWVELKPGEILNPAYELKEVKGKNGSYWDLRKPGAPYGHTTYTEREAVLASNREALQDQLKYEGDTMGHCVGGYCDDVLSGRSRIYSLRDAKGEPHVTVETQPMKRGYLPEPSDNPDELIGHRIKQIKGKQNRKPNDEYLPFVQDFVRNHPEGGKWEDVGDFDNTGLKRLADFGDEPMIQAAREKYGEYVTPNEWESIMNPKNFAESGAAQAEPQWQPFAGGYILR